MIEKSDSEETTGGSLSSGVEELEENCPGGLRLTATASETVKGTGPGDGGDGEDVEGAREDTQGCLSRPMRWELRGLEEEEEMEKEEMEEEEIQEEEVEEVEAEDVAGS